MTDNAKTSAHKGTGGMIDPLSLMRIKSLELRAKVIVEGFWKGIHRSPYHGFSVEFTEYRPYTFGDDPRYIDWQVYARSDRYYIKKFQDETNLRCHLLIDHSRSMGYSSGEYSKAQYAGTLAATLGYFLYTQGDAVGGADEGQREGQEGDEGGGAGVTAIETVAVADSATPSLAANVKLSAP